MIALSISRAASAMRLVPFGWLAAVMITRPP
jgi:hypothetical protein